MTARDVHERLNGMETGWANWDTTVDTFNAGDATPSYTLDSGVSWTNIAAVAAPVPVAPVPAPRG